jgi:hypothetical protein
MENETQYLEVLAATIGLIVAIIGLWPHISNYLKKKKNERLEKKLSMRIHSSIKTNEKPEIIIGVPNINFRIDKETIDPSEITFSNQFPFFIIKNISKEGIFNFSCNSQVPYDEIFSLITQYNKDKTIKAKFEEGLYSYLLPRVSYFLPTNLQAKFGLDVLGVNVSQNIPIDRDYLLTFLLANYINIKTFQDVKWIDNFPPLLYRIVFFDKNRIQHDFQFKLYVVNIDNTIWRFEINNM